MFSFFVCCSLMIHCFYDLLSSGFDDPDLQLGDGKGGWEDTGKDVQRERK